MARRKKKADRIGKSKSSTKPEPSKTIELKVIGDDDSDAGTFMDDDTEDFLLSKWHGKAEDKKIEPPVKPEVQASTRKRSTSSMINTPAKLPATVQDLIPGMGIGATQTDTTVTTIAIYTTSSQIAKTSVADNVSLTEEQESSVDANESTKSDNQIKSTSTVQDCIPKVLEKGSISQPTKTEMVTIRRLQVPAHMVRKPMTELEDLRAEVKTLKLAKEKQDYYDAEYRQLHQLYHQVRGEKFQQASKISRLVDDLVKSQSSVEVLDRELRRVRQELDRENMEVHNSNENAKRLEIRITELITDLKLKEPLVKEAAKIRLRYLEQAREWVLKVPHAHIDRAIIANVAAHSANGALDAALFKLKLVDEEYEVSAREIYTELYQKSPEHYTFWTPKVHRVLDCAATLKTLKATKGRPQSSKRVAHGLQFQKLRGRYHNTTFKKDFETDEDVEELLNKLEELTNTIVEEERSKPCRRRNRVSGDYDDCEKELMKE